MVIIDYVVEEFHSVDELVLRGEKVQNVIMELNLIP